MKKAYVKLITEVLTRNTDKEILRFVEDLVEGVQMRQRVLKEGTDIKSNDKDPNKSLKDMGIGALAGGVYGGGMVGLANGIKNNLNKKMFSDTNDKLSDANISNYDLRTELNKLKNPPIDPLSPYSFNPKDHFEVPVSDEEKLNFEKRTPQQFGKGYRIGGPPDYEYLKLPKR